MLAYQFTTWEQDFELREVPTPEPGPGETLVRVAGAGVCHSDLYLCDWPKSSLPSYDLPFTVGHEITGWVEETGPGVSGLQAGTPVAVYGAWGCGACGQCDIESENYCENAAEVVASGPGRPGLGRDGGIAEFFLAPMSHHLVPLPTDLDPVEAAPLTDAGLTTYHAIRQNLDRLGEGTTAVVIGIGGLGSLAVQILRALSSARVIAVDVAPARLEVALRHGAHHAFLSTDSPSDAIRELTGGRGADLVLDIVGIDDTLSVAVSAAAIRGHITVVGMRARVVSDGIPPGAPRPLGLHRVLGHRPRPCRGGRPRRDRGSQERHRDVLHAGGSPRLPEAPRRQLGGASGDRPPQAAMRLP